AACRAKFARRHENLALREVREAAVVVGMEMGEHHAFHISRPDAEPAQLRTDFFLALDPKGYIPSVIGMEGPAAVDEMRPFARIDNDHAFGMVDHPCVGWEPIGPMAVGKHAEASSQAASPTFDLRRLDPDGTSLYRLNVHTRSAIDRTTSGRPK